MINKSFNIDHIWSHLNVQTKTILLFSFLVAEGTLTEMVAQLAPDVGLVLQMPFVCTRKGFASVYEQVEIHFETHHV